MSGEVLDSVSTDCHFITFVFTPIVCFCLSCYVYICMSANQCMLYVLVCVVVVIVVGRFYIALFSALERTHCVCTGM